MIPEHLGFEQVAGCIYRAIADIVRGFDLSCTMFASGRGLPLIMAVDE